MDKSTREFKDEARQSHWIGWDGMGNGGIYISLQVTASRQRRLLLGGVYSWGFSLLVDDGIFLVGLGEYSSVV